MEGVTSTGNPNTQRVRPAGPVRLQVTEEQKKSIKQIKEFIRSCLEKDSSLDPTGANISPTDSMIHPHLSDPFLPHRRLILVKY